MKYLTIILLFLFSIILGTCTTTKKRTLYKSAKPDTEETDFDSDGVPDYQDVEPNIPPKVGSVNRNREASPTFKSTDFPNDLNKKKITVVDKSDTQIEETQPFIKGLIAYAVPDEMIVGDSYSIKIRISKNNQRKGILVIDDRNVSITDTTINSTVTIESIRISPIMSAALLSNGDHLFKITPKSTEIQNIDDSGYTEWEWNVVPLKGGSSELKLIVKVRVITEDGERSFKDIVVFQRNITVKSNIHYSIITFVGKYWQWSLSSLIIPFIVWFYNRKKKKKED